jgi:hypothetical protein
MIEAKVTMLVTLTRTVSLQPGVLLTDEDATESFWDQGLGKLYDDDYDIHVEKEKVEWL